MADVEQQPIMEGEQHATEVAPAQSEGFETYNDATAVPAETKPVQIEWKITKIEENAEELRKLFVGGLNRETTDEQFREHFSKYGEVIDSIIIRDENKLSRGFGFVTFGTIEATDTCIKDKKDESIHVMQGKKVDIKRAIPKELPPSQHDSRDKVFLGGIKDGITEEILGKYFEDVFGIKEKTVSLKRDPEGKLKGFGFLTLDADTDDMLKSDVVDKIIIVERHNLNGTQFHAKKAAPKNQSYNYRGRGGHGGGYRGRGGFGGYQQPYGQMGGRGGGNRYQPY